MEELCQVQQGREAQRESQERPEDGCEAGGREKPNHQEMGQEWRVLSTWYCLVDNVIPGEATAGIRAYRVCHYRYRLPTSHCGNY